MHTAEASLHGLSFLTIWRPGPQDQSEESTRRQPHNLSGPCLRSHAFIQVRAVAKARPLSKGKGLACTFCWASLCGHFRQMQLALITEEAGRRGSQGESFCPDPHSTGGPPSNHSREPLGMCLRPRGWGAGGVAFLPPGPHTEACGGASIWLVGWICHWEKNN